MSSQLYHHPPQDSLYHYTYYLYGYWYTIQDQRTKDFPLVSIQPWTMASIMAGYYLFVTRVGPSLLKNRPPFQLRRTMFVYNLTMVTVNLYFLYEAAKRADYFRVFLNFHYPDRNDNSPQTLWEINLGWWYWMSKFADLFDTVFYVLRKKDSTHVNFLHLYHHISVPSFGYLLLKINPGIPSAHLFILLNTSVHSCMYLYYALAALGPRVQRWLWWKRYITMLQLAQFVIGIFYGMLVAQFQTGYPPVWLYVGLMQPPFFFWMFYKFYRQTYYQSGSPATVSQAPNQCMQKSIKSQ